MPHLQTLTLETSLLYDWECRHVNARSDQDVAFYLDVARRHPGPILELGCGTGRVTASLATTGHEVVGLDNDRSMLRSARRLCPDVALVAADMRRFALHRHFALVVVAYNSFQLLDPQGLNDCLACIREHVMPGGVVAFEVADFSDGAGGCDEEFIASGELHGHALELFGSLDHDPATGAVTYRRRWVLDGASSAQVSCLWPVTADSVAAAGLAVAVFGQAGAPR